MTASPNCPSTSPIWLISRATNSRCVRSSAGARFFLSWPVSARMRPSLSRFSFSRLRASFRARDREPFSSDISLRRMPRRTRRSDLTSTTSSTSWTSSTRISCSRQLRASSLSRARPLATSTRLCWKRARACERLWFRASGHACSIRWQRFSAYPWRSSSLRAMAAVGADTKACSQPYWLSTSEHRNRRLSRVLSGQA